MKNRFRNSWLAIVVLFGACRQEPANTFSNLVLQHHIPGVRLQSPVAEVSEHLPSLRPVEGEGYEISLKGDIDGFRLATLRPSTELLRGMERRIDRVILQGSPVSYRMGIQNRINSVFGSGPLEIGCIQAGTEAAEVRTWVEPDSYVQLATPNSTSGGLTLTIASGRWDGNKLGSMYRKGPCGGRA